MEKSIIITTCAIAALMVICAFILTCWPTNSYAADKCYSYALPLKDPNGNILGYSETVYQNSFTKERIIYFDDCVIKHSNGVRHHATVKGKK